jgi:Glyoxalase-like domain
MTEANEMAGYLRLRQICLVAPRLESAISDIAAIMGLSVCYRDGNVAKYGLENALLPVDTILLEVVAPFQDGTAAGRFLQKTGGRGGYMAIFCCDDPDARGKHANAIGVRTANVITHAPYRGVQLHPRDCRAAFIEFNHTDGSDDVLGPYPPAGPDWQKSIRKDVTQALTGVEMQSPEPEALAKHWGRILEIPVSKNAGGEPELKLPNASFAFVKGKSDLMSGLTFKAGNVGAVLEAAKSKGCAVSGDGFDLCGVTFRLAA